MATGAIMSIPHLHSVKTCPGIIKQTNQVWGLDVQCNDSFNILNSYKLKLGRKNILIYGANYAGYYSDSHINPDISLRSDISGFIPEVRMQPW